VGRSAHGGAYLHRVSALPAPGVHCSSRYLEHQVGGFPRAVLGQTCRQGIELGRRMGQAFGEVHHACPSNPHNIDVEIHARHPEGRTARLVKREGHARAGGQGRPAAKSTGPLFGSARDVDLNDV
jgi:hypothetical protein